jgi:EAL domain-containing protein (putative c-di-GMP-specific phosphodiesterase class I)
MSAVVPFGVIVAVAIVFIVIAVLSSAQRANDVALDTEQQLFMRALADRGERVPEISDAVLKEIAWRLGLNNLRRMDAARSATGDHVLQLADEKGEALARFAWTPSTPGQGASNFVDMVERTLSATDFDPCRLELEVTETTLLGNVEAAELAMRRLKALGVRLALDDFGTGHSSLLYLRRIPFDKLKIDSSFVRNIDRAADAAAIMHAVVSLGRGLGMSVTAEGVETADQQLFLRAAGVHSMQGYRFGRPCRADELASRLDESGSLDGEALALAV